MKEWLVKHRFKKGTNKKYEKQCKICKKCFMSNGPKEHCSWKCFLYLKREIDHKGCWIWKGSLTNKGYGKTSNSKLVHRLSYEIFREEIPKGMFVCHACDVPNCFNPNHLFIASHKENMQDCTRKGRRCGFKGSKNPMSILSEYDVMNIKDLFKFNFSFSCISNIYKISIAQISNIKNEKQWKHVK